MLKRNKASIYRHSSRSGFSSHVRITRRHQPNGENDNANQAKMRIERYAELLKDEYMMLHQLIIDVGNRAVTIRGWSITIASAAIGTGILTNKVALLLGFGASLMFWILEASTNAERPYLFARLTDIERIFQDEKWEREVPLQVYSTSLRERARKGDQTLRYAFRRSSSFPHMYIAIFSLLLYFFL